ncbi:MAG TPA: hypothetical protein VF708_02325 [Pyrinomonadaceae bacterium]|jgi:outer membrane biosynthesis protein TonB
MKRRKVRALKKRQASRREKGFTLMQLVIVVAVIAIVTTFSVMGISKARASIRLSSSSRKLAAYLERARGDSVRRRAWARITKMSPTVYRVQMDTDGNGTVDAMDITLDEGVTFDSAFAWTDVTFVRGTLPGEVFFKLKNESSESPSTIIITASGDITLNSQVFHDASIPAVTLNSNVSGDVAGDPAMANVNTGWPAPTPDPVPTPFPTPTPTPTPTPSPSPSPSPSPAASPSPSASPSPTASPSASPSPSPSATPSVCTVLSDKASITIQRNGGSDTVSISLTGVNTSANYTISTSNSNGNLTVTPTSKVVTGTGAASFTIKSNDNHFGVYTVYFGTSTSCFKAIVVNVIK